MRPDPSRPTRRCDGGTRRDFLHLGMLSCLGFSVADLLRARAASAAAPASATAPARPDASAAACILIWLDGGPSHLETFDPKPDAPADVRGEFRPIGTSVDGVRI